jgi:hypothetical protein
MNASEIEEHRQKLEQKLAQDRAELIQAAQDLQPQIRALDRAEKRVRLTAELLPIIGWALAELALVAVATRWARMGRRAGWPALAFQAWRAWKVLRAPRTQ